MSERNRNWKQKYNEKLTKAKKKLKKMEDDETEMTTLEEWAVKKKNSVLLNRCDFQFENYSIVHG